MSTSSKGDFFLRRVFEYFETELNEDNLYIPSKTSKLFQKKAYYSKDRKSNIITDISIETSLPSASDYSLLTIVECKDYSTNIPVDDIEEFHAKVQQISGNNVKAIFATTTALQKAALAYAKSKKIAVIRFLPTDQVDWAHYSRNFEWFSKQTRSDTSGVDSPFLNQKYIGHRQYFYGYFDDYTYDSLPRLLKYFLNMQ